jgi:hypothetical protein
MVRNLGEMLAIRCVRSPEKSAGFRKMMLMEQRKAHQTAGHSPFLRIVVEKSGWLTCLDLVLYGHVAFGGV